MAPLKPIAKFNCTIAALYAVCRLCWNSCLDNIADFTAFKTFYNAAFVTAALAEIDAAEDMPDEHAREAAAKEQHDLLQQAGSEALAHWRMLRAYIKSAFTGVGIETALETAGNDYYATAYHENWEDMQQLMNRGSEFITDNTAALTAAGMPAIFPAAFDDVFTEFTDKYNSFKDAQQDAEEGTVNRMNANNDLYDRMMALNADGQTMYEGDAGKYNRFVFARVLELVTPQNGETIKATYEQPIGPDLKINFGLWVEGTNAMRVTLVSGETIVAGRSLEGNTIDGVPIMLAVPGSETEPTAYFSVNGPHIVVHNQSLTVAAVVRIELLG